MALSDAVYIQDNWSNYLNDYRVGSWSLLSCDKRMVSLSTVDFLVPFDCKNHPETTDQV